MIKFMLGKPQKTIHERLVVHIYAAFTVQVKTRFYNAMRKYGKDAFSIELIDTAYSKEECDEKERMWIKKLNSTNRDIGYNDCLGGEGGNTFICKTKEEMEEISRKISQKLKGGNNGNATPIKCKNIKTNEIFYFKSSTECKEFFKRRNIEIKNRLYFNHCKYNKKYHVQPLFNDTFIFAYDEDDFLNILLLN